MNWQLSSNDPVTTERRRHVFRADDPAIQGWIALRWKRNNVEFYGPVYQEYPQYKVLDDAPTIGGNPASK